MIKMHPIFLRPELLVQKIAKCWDWTLLLLTLREIQQPSLPSADSFQIPWNQKQNLALAVFFVVVVVDIKAFKENPAKDLTTNKISCLPQICLNLCYERSGNLLQGWGQHQGLCRYWCMILAGQRAELVCTMTQGGLSLLLGSKTLLLGDLISFMS